ncbi:MAG: hypothetical protein PWP08_830 [Methanofollis sp.]|nr:hypothetical protein [Methanofollis sp.]
MNSKLFIITVMLILPFVLSSGCISGETQVQVDGYYEASGIALLSNPFNVNLHLEATNLGDIDAKNVEAIVQMTYDGTVVGQDKVSFGTVKVGIPVSKDTVAKVTIPSAEWANFDSDKLNLAVKTIIIDGEIAH